MKVSYKPKPNLLIEFDAKDDIDEAGYEYFMNLLSIKRKKSKQV